MDVFIYVLLFQAARPIKQTNRRTNKQTDGQTDVQLGL